MLRFRCPHCQGKYKVPDRKRGTLIQCPHCERRLSVPYEGSSYEIPYVGPERSKHLEPSKQSPDDNGPWLIPEDEDDNIPFVTDQINDTDIEQPGEYENSPQSANENKNEQHLPPQPNAKTSRLAIASLILGLLVIPAILGLILGVIARKKIRQSQRQLKGAGLALAGIILSSVTLISSIAGGVIYFNGSGNDVTVEAMTPNKVKSEAQVDREPTGGARENGESN